MQTDIAQLLTNIKLNIAAVEQGKRHTAILNEIEYCRRRAGRAPRCGTG